MEDFEGLGIPGPDLAVELMAAVLTRHESPGIKSRELCGNQAHKFMLTGGPVNLKTSQSWRMRY